MHYYYLSIIITATVVLITVDNCAVLFDILQGKDSKSQKDLCIDELVTTEEKFITALQMIREVSG